MSRICAMSSLTLQNSNTTNGNKNINNIFNNNGNNRSIHTRNGIQEILNNLKLIKEKIEFNGVSQNEAPNGVTNGYINDLNGDNHNSHTCLPLKKSLKQDSNLVEDNNEKNDFEKIRKPLLRSTSLKTGKPPTGAPQRKKIVIFADAKGLDLESVRLIISDDMPYIPSSAFSALKSIDYNNESYVRPKQIPWFMQKQFTLPALNRAKLMLDFIEPSSLLNFMDRVRNNKVCLENCMVSNSAGNLSITCIIRVLNISFEKSVILRYTLNEWLTANEALASYIPNSCDGISGKFTVTFSVSGYSLSSKQRLLFAVKYLANSEEYWDNNMGQNYSLIYRV